MSEHVLSVELVDRAGPVRGDVIVNRLIIAGWAGRDKQATEKHIAELEAMGVRRPASTPIFYRVGASRLTTGPSIDVLGDRSSGEAECVILRARGRLWVGVGSDHTDRNVETYDISVSKQVCDKPIASTFWSYDDVEAHWDQLVLRSLVSEEGMRVVYQEGAVTALLPPADLMGRLTGVDAFAEGTLMYCGTLPVIGGIRPASRFEFELEDPVESRKIHHAYTVNRLPVIG